MKAKQVIVFFKLGTIDCYTGIDTKTGDVFGFNANPFHPMGFGQFCGNVTDRLNVTYGYGWRNHFDEKKALRSELRNYLSEARNKPEWLGKEIKISDLPEAAQQYVRQLIEE